ncbi:MAG: UDP-N-acetylmuramyl-tripeptide synthetase [Candidatus Colwellbacteria bacterium]|nr:UDP-N-acetylmuramyl-tripeptide synthetase [Candidatus Colwellbacteria bacterium]
MYRARWAPFAYHFTLGLVGEIVYFFPSWRVKAIGVTGTKGKSTTLELINAILEESGKRTAILSSIRIKLGEDSKVNVLGNTQPGRFFIQYFLKQAVKNKCDYVLLEVTSEGVRLSRHRFVKWRQAIITNIAPEHIETHGSFDNYRRAKFRFLKYASRRGAPVFINGDDEQSEYFRNAFKKRRSIIYSKIDLPNFRERVYELLPGEFNKENMAAAISVVRSLGISEEIIKQAIESFPGVPGRMEFVKREPFNVVVDYAHTPDSLEVVYQTLTQATKGKLICVLGSAGGGRDKWKRPKLGEIASRYCGEIILTDEDPFDEDPAQIIAEIKTGVSIPNLHEVLDRKEAIKKAVGLATPGDTVIITGKGSEPYLRVAHGQKIPWSDREFAIEAINTT